MSSIAQLRPNRSDAPDPAVLLAAVQASTESLAIVLSGLVVYANPAWCRMFECADLIELQGRSLEDLIPPRSFGLVSEAGRSEATSLAPEARFVHVRRDGVAIPIEVARSSFSLRGREFQVIQVRDLSGQRQTEQQLQESQRLEAIGRLVGVVAHDFNNLLTGILLYCDLLIGELEKDSRPHLHAREMHLVGEHGSALVQQLLALARPPAEDARVLALNDVVSGIADLLTRLVGENIVLTTALAEDLGAVRMDPAQAQQILLNLVLNARDAMPDGGRITVSTRNGSDDLLFGPERKSEIVCWVELAVMDTGVGMDAETLDQAFEPFFTTKQPGRGNGLGLTSAARLARQEGGIIIAESEPGKGTRVALRLPRVQPDTSSNSKVKEVIS